MGTLTGHSISNPSLPRYSLETAPHPQPTLSSSRCEIPKSRHQVIKLLQDKFSEKEANLVDELYCKGEPRGQEGGHDGA